MKNIHWIEYALGLIVYFIFISNEQFSLGIIWLIFILYTWTITAFIIKQYSLYSFICALSFLGVVVSLTIFFTSGIEQVPFPRGAVQFKLDGIAQALIIFFIFTLPLLLFNKQTNFNLYSSADQISESKTPELTKSPSVDLLNTPTLKDQEWEEATIEDIESGKFESI